MAMPPEVANDALNVTLAVVQSLMKRFIKVKEGDPEALRLSDKIARHMAKDLKLYSGNATSFSPQLLSFATVVRQHSKGGAFENIPDWTSITNNDPQIKSHPQFKKTMDYRPPSTLKISTIATSTDIPATIPIPLAPIVPPSTPLTLPSMPFHTDPDFITKPVVEPKRWLRERKNPPVPRYSTAGPPARFHHLYMTNAQRKQEKEVLQVGSSKKRKASNSLLLQELLPVTTDKDIPPVTDKGFWDAETWNEARILMSLLRGRLTNLKHFIRYHPRQCNKCAKLDIACLVLPDKKFGYTHLACANCNNMKITCAINGVGVWQRLQGVEKKPMEVLLGWPQMQPELGQSAPTNLLEPEPTAREILQGIQDLGRRLDLLATNGQVRVGLVETNLLKRLDELEQRLNESDAQWKSLESLG
ncbi:uncharacterized protein HD556DRAFT_1312465 [Suillus plorans]|uniref:Uncharacterized protein n=1 Tax=Suillus plorans TaxID=116603 RepID=A0A9P7DC02_9AGAM|nr:uncharacterized protein HD556DRAFT_1312465 [Suillus plorans]KAG1787887.1 hypothetical protein HD556DRAFT_1312465 [Suillus plorans]